MKDEVYIYALHSLFLNAPVVVRELLESEQPDFIFKLDRSELMEIFKGDEQLVERICSPMLLEESAREVDWAKSKGVKLLSVLSDDYPKLLKECRDAPPLLFYIGNADLNSAYNVSVVGTRMATAYGRETCGRVVHAFENENVMIVSGMAFGIDVCAHRAAVEAGLPTVGVLPCGIDMIYPKAHRSIAKQMLERGGIITEFPRGMEVRRWQFIKRNRIIAGMSRATVVVESRIKGGAMVTAEFAAGYGRDIYAVPGRLGDTNSFGCNYLISKNIAQICLPYSLKESMGLCGSYVPLSQMQPDLFSHEDDKKEKILLSLKINSKAGIDFLCADTGLSFSDVAPALLELELEGFITMNKSDEYVLRNSRQL